MRNLLTNFVRSTIGRIVSIFLLISGFITIFQITPAQLTSNLGAWADMIKSIDSNWIWLSILILMLLSFIQIYQQGIQQVSANQHSEPDKKPQYMVALKNYSQEELGQILRQLIETKQIDEIKVFAYTAETLRDYIAYADRYRALSIQILVRNWLAEQEDEADYNTILMNRDAAQRPWRKSAKIKSLASDFYHEMQSRPTYKISVKFFDNPPVFRGFIVRNRSTGYTVGFLSLYDWQEFPIDGGSQFKGEGGVVFQLESTGSDRENIALKRFITQFDLLWLKNSKTFEDLKNLEQI